MSQRERYTDDEWRTLQLVPLVAYFAVGHADGSVSPAEAAEYRRKLAQISGLTAPGTELAREVFESLVVDEDEVQQRYDAARRSEVRTEVLLRDASVLLDRAEPGQATAFRHVVRVLCQSVAEASPIVGEKVTAQEHAAIDLVVAQLASRR